MKLSMWSSYYIELSPEQMVLELEKYGYIYSELSDEHSLMLMERGDAYEVGLEFKKFADAHHVSFPQGHLKLSARICNDEDRAFLKRQLDLFRAVGVQHAVLHYDGLSQFPDLSVDEIRRRNVMAIRDLIDHIKDTDMVICLENLGGKPITQSADDILWFIETLGSEHLGICLDTGHLNLSPNTDQAKFIRTAGKHLKALHLADNDGSGDQHLMPCARGQVDFAEVIRETRKIGYEGIYNYEVPGERNAPLPIKGFKLDYIRRVTNFYWDACDEF